MSEIALRIQIEGQQATNQEQNDALPRQADLIVISDVHLRSLESDDGMLFLALLGAIATAAPAHLVFLGDIFDFTLGSSRFFRRKYAEVGITLARIRAAGTRVTFIEGNHEFDMAHHGWEGVEVFSDLKLVLALASGERVSLSHGDGICSPWRYHAYRRVVRSPWFLAFFRMLPGRFIDRLALTCSQASRNQDEHRKVDHSKILNLADAWFAADGQQHNYGLFGHFHEPFAVKGRDYDGKMIGLPSWNKPNALVYHDGHFSRFYFRMQDGRIATAGLEPVVFSESAWEL